MLAVTNLKNKVDILGAYGMIFGWKHNQSLGVDFQIQSMSSVRFGSISGWSLTRRMLESILAE